MPLLETISPQRINDFVRAHCLPPRVGAFLETISPQKINDHKEFQEAEKFTLKIEPLPDTSYSWIYDYGNRKFDMLNTAWKEVDDKANELIKYLGGGTGVFSLVVSLNIKSINSCVVLAALPSFVFALIAIYIAIQARKPCTVFLPPSVEDAFCYANTYKKEDLAKGAFIGQLHLACVGMQIALNSKAEQVKSALWAFFVSIGLLLVPMIVAIMFVSKN